MCALRRWRLPDNYEFKIHWREDDKSGYSHRLCNSKYVRSNEYNIRWTTNPEEVTCKVCKSLLVMYKYRIVFLLISFLLYYRTKENSGGLSNENSETLSREAI